MFKVSTKISLTFERKFKQNINKKSYLVKYGFTLCVIEQKQT